VGLALVQPAPLRDRFYNSPQWLTLRRACLKRDHYRCVVCNISVAGKGQARVDHIKPRKQSPELALDLANLRTLCPLHDNQSHREKGARSPIRDERFVVRGCDAEGWPLDQRHPWHRP